MKEALAQHEEDKKKFEDERHWGKCGYIATYRDGVIIHIKTIVEIDFKKVLSNKSLGSKNKS